MTPCRPRNSSRCEVPGSLPGSLQDISHSHPIKETSSPRARGTRTTFSGSQPREPFPSPLLHALESTQPQKLDKSRGLVACRSLQRQRHGLFPQAAICRPLPISVIPFIPFIPVIPVIPFTPSPWYNRLQCAACSPDSHLENDGILGWFHRNNNASVFL